MVKIKILNSGLIQEVQDTTVCWDTGRTLMRIVDANVGDLIILTRPEDMKDIVAQILAKVKTREQ